MITKITNKVKKKLLILVVGILIVGGVGLVVWSNRNASVQAAWFDDNFAYRQTVTVTNNGSAQTAYQHQVVLGTGDLVVAGKMQSDCDDVRFTDASGKVISHWNEYCFSASGKNSSFWLYFDSLPAGTSTVYVYYGNPAATTASLYRANPSGINIGTGNDGSITVASNSNINTTTIISGRSCADGGDGVNYSVTENRAAGTSQVVLSSTPASGCLTAGDEVVIINLQGSSSDNSNVGKFELARINSISVATLTLNHALVNGYDGSTQKIMVQRVPNYGSVTVNSSVTFTAAAWNGTKGGVLMFRSNGTVTVSSSALLDVNSLGYRGGAGGVSNAGGVNGESYDGSVGSGGANATQGTSGGGGGDQSNTTSTGTRSGGGGGGEGGLAGQADNDGSGGGGGGGYGSGGGGGAGAGSGLDDPGGNGGTASTTSDTNAGGGGGGGAVGSDGGAGGGGNTAGTTTSGTGGVAGSAAVTGGGGGGGTGCGACSGGGGGGGGYRGAAALTTLFLGGGGGGAGGNNASGATGGAGGQAGGIVYVGATTLTNSGTIRSNGAAASAVAASVGGGGAGAGGSIFIGAQTATLGSSTVTSSGGAVSNGTIHGGGGGSGGVGRIAVNYSTSTGSTSPTATTSTLPASGASANEEKSPAPVAYWKFDEGTGTVAKDGTSNGNNGTLSGTTVPTWQSEDLCVSGKCLYFNGITSNVTAGTAAGVQTVSFWTKAASSSASLIQLASGVDVKATSGAVATDGFTTPTIYVNGQPSTTFTANQWNYITVTTGTGITANSITLGKMQTGVLNGFLDEVKLYNYARSAEQIKLDYNSKMAALAKGASAVLGASNSVALSEGLVGYWKMDESSGNAADSSGNATTLTNTNTATYTTGKFGNAGTFVAASSQFFTASDNATLSMGSAISYTLSAWVNLTTNSSEMWIIGKSSDALGREYVLRYGALSANTFDCGTTGANLEAKSFGAVSTGTWYFVTCWYDAAKQEMGISVNDTKPDIVTGVTNTSNLTNPFELGAEASATKFWNGKIDEARVYKRVLSGAERTQLYNFAPGPVGYWNFEEKTGSVLDKSGQGNNGTWSGSGTSRYAPGKFGSGGNFDGSTDYINMGNVNSLERTDGMTFSAWIKTTSSSEIKILSKMANSAPFAGYEFFVVSGKVTLFLINTWNTNILYVNGGTSVNDGNWHFVAISYDGTSSASGVKIYVDGKLESNTVTYDTLSGAVTNSTNLNIGARNGSVNFWSSGLDEVKLYKYVRTQKQIIEDMNAGHPAGGSPVGSTINYWKFDEGQGTTTNDSGYGRNAGTLNSMASPASVGISGWNPNGQFNKSLSFDGSDDDVSFGDLAWTEGTSTISGTFWVKPITVAATKCLVCKYNNAATQRSWAVETGTANASAVRVTIPTTTTEADGTTFAETPTGKLTAGVWTQVAFIYDGGQVGNVNRLKIYINGVKQNAAYTGTIPSATQATTSNATAGQASDSSRNFTGDLDEIKLYSGALTEAEIKVDYNRSSAIAFGVLGTSTADGKTASNSAATAYCVPGDTTSCNPPVGEWKMEEGSGNTTNDTTGNAQTGTLTSGPVWSNGKYGKGLALDGVAAHVSVADSDLLDLTSTFTIEGWVKFNTFNAGDARLVAKENAGGGVTSNSYGFAVRTTGKLRFTIFAVVDINDTGSQTVPLGQWTHIAVTHSGTSYKFYINGNLNSDITNANNATANTATFLIGRRNNTTEVINGSVDNVRIFSTALSTAQIAYEYNRGLPVAHWKVDECQGATLNDSVGTASATITIGATDQASVGTCTANANTFWYNGRTGKYNYSGNFDGDDDYAATGNLAMIIANGSTSTNVSWGGWFKPATSVASKTLIHKTNEFRLMTDANSKPVCEIYSGSWQTGATSNVAIALGQWSHVLCTYDGAFIRTYVNGLQVGYTAETDSLTGTANALNIARDSASSYYEGQIDEVKVWNYPLTAYQVKIDNSQASAVRFGPLTGSP